VLKESEIPLCSQLRTLLSYPTHGTNGIKPTFSDRET
jgi:hypothetical protein